MRPRFSRRTLPVCSPPVSVYFSALTRFRFYIVALCAALLVASLVSCSTKKNTAGSRWWHSFTARYNTYFNGHEAFLEGEKAKAEGHKDDFTELLPVFLVANEQSRELGKSQFETTITKCQKAVTLHSIKRKPQVDAGKRRSAKMKQYLQRQEFNPFLKQAWLLMGQAQFEKGNFLEAAATFSYIARLYAAEPPVAAEARQWLARCYAQVGWYYDAEEALSHARRDSLGSSARREACATQADLLLRQQRYAEAVPFLEQAARHAKGEFRQARLWYLLGQVCHQLDRPREAYKALARCIRKSPPYELSFHARLMQAEVSASRKGNDTQALKQLRRMARSEKNKDYLDLVYYAIGNLYLARRDTVAAISAYVTGRSRATRTGPEKGVLLLRLGGLYWDKRHFSDAQKCYTEALGMIDKSRADYEEVTRRSKVLDKLVPYTSAVHLQDSLQALSRMGEAERNAAIDRVIEALKKREEEERKLRRDSAAQARAEEMGLDTGNENTPAGNKGQQTQIGNQASQTWYFYNPMLVIQGKEDFKKRWGGRKNEDNWRRSNRTVVNMQDHEGYDYAADDSLQAAADSLAQAEQAVDSLQQKEDPSADPHQRAYYLKQIPFTEEARAASDAIIKDGLYNAGVIEKDDLEDFPLAAETLERLTHHYTDYEHMPEAWYQLFLLYSRWGRPDRADEARRQLAARFPDNELTRLITDPNFERYARYGKQIEDSLYKATYLAYRQRDNATVEANFNRSTDKFPSGANRPKFIFVHALSRLGTASSPEIVKELRGLLTQYPESDVSPMAGMIVKGLESGRKLGTGTFDLGSLWDRRTAAADSVAQGAAAGRQFSPELTAPYLFVLAYPTDSIDSDKLLYEMAHFNFTTFVVRGFDMTVVHDQGLSQFRVAGFTTFEEAHAYAQRVYASKELRPFLDKGRVLLISKDNLELLQTTFSINDYLKYYEKTFAPLRQPDQAPVEQTAPIEQHYEDEYTPEELERMRRKEEPANEPDDGGEWY